MARSKQAAKKQPKLNADGSPMEQPKRRVSQKSKKINTTMAGKSTPGCNQNNNTKKNKKKKKKQEAREKAALEQALQQQQQTSTSDDAVASASTSNNEPTPLTEKPQESFGSVLDQQTPTDPPSTTTTPGKAGTPGLSTGVKNLRFMQHKQEKNAESETGTFSANSQPSPRIRVAESFMELEELDQSTRKSFQGFNPDIEKLQKAANKKLRKQEEQDMFEQIAINSKKHVEVADEEMAARFAKFVGKSKDNLEKSLSKAPSMEPSVDAQQKMKNKKRKNNKNPDSSD
eukprot:m.29755 g.29755  ORF g.29755 m.29755 type:complete len:287 (-) comp16154_c0_seq2:374-1234(-)